MLDNKSGRPSMKAESEEACEMRAVGSEKRCFKKDNMEMTNGHFPLINGEPEMFNTQERRPQEVQSRGEVRRWRVENKADKSLHVYSSRFEQSAEEKLKEEPLPKE